MITDKQAANCIRLADFLETLDPKHFNMVHWFAEYTGDEVITVPIYSRMLTHSCGTVACALGHGPMAGIKPAPKALSAGYIHWAVYSEQFVDTNSFGFVFAWEWADIDNTPAGAVKRLRYIAEAGQPPADFDDDLDHWGDTIDKYNLRG